MSGVRAPRVSRRMILAQAGRGVLGMAVLELAACAGTDPAGIVAGPAQSGAGDGLAWSRVDLAYVSAYVLVRGSQAAVVDTGVEGSADRIGAALEAAGTGWEGVRHVLITHTHFDHVGGLEEVARRASGAKLYGGKLDLDTIGPPPPVAGDALTNTVDGILGGSLPMVTPDKAAAADSVHKLAALDPRVILVGHGPPVEHDAAAKLRYLASTLN